VRPRLPSARLATLLAAAILLPSAAAPQEPAARGAPAADASLEERARALARWKPAFSHRDPERRARAYALLHPAWSESLPACHEGLRDGDWRVRGAAAALLAGVPEGPLRFQIRIDALRHADERVREGIVFALADAPLPGDGEALAGALEDRSPRVRADAARGLRAAPSRGALDALVAALARETDARPRCWIRDTLRGLTGAWHLDAAAWRAWWAAHREDERFLPPDEAPPETREFEGIPLEVVSVPSRGGEGGGAGAEKRPVLFVLAPFGWSHALFRPWFDDLEEVFRVSYVRLPPLRELTGLSGYGSQIGSYPAARLARALEALRKDRGAGRVCLFADGPSSWIAEVYAAAYPSTTAGLLLANGWLDAASYGAALGRLAAAGTDEERAVAASLRGERGGARDPAEERAMGRVFLGHRLLDRADLLGHLLWTRAREPEGFATVPSLALDRRHRIEVPALWIFPSGSPLSGHHEAERLREAMPKALVATLEETRGLPWIDRHDEFHRVVRGFVRRHGLDR
jgi:hypothetical protein